MFSLVVLWFEAFVRVFRRKLSHLDKQLQVGQGELPAPSIESVDEEMG